MLRYSVLALKQYTFSYYDFTENKNRLNVHNIPNSKTVSPTTKFSQDGATNVMTFTF